ncbi:MAG: hypothetical protein ACRD0Z_02155 [Acidimicrobiales bacterium]
MTRPWRREPAAAPGSDLTDITQLDLIDVTLKTEFSGEQAEVTGLVLGFDASGMTVRKADGTSVVTIPWGTITGLSADVVGNQQHALSTAVALDVQSRLKTHRFVVPNVQPGALTSSLGVISSRYGPAVQPQAKGHRR